MKSSILRFPSLLALSTCWSPSFAQEAGTSAGHAAAKWGADYFPNVELTTHEGKVVRFFDDLIRDKVVVVNFFYTSCPDACPLETARLVEVQDILAERVGKDVFMYSISIDPARDTPEALANYAERFQVGPGWLFLTGAEKDVLSLRRKLGVLSEGETALQDHNLSLVIGNQATGRWMRRSPFENAFVLADEIGEWLHNWKLAPRAGGDYSEAPKLPTVSRGELLFRTRCSACHVIGMGDGLARAGPNLLDVSHRRERVWLERWIAQPDRMLAEGDPLALLLFEGFNRIPMPNMRLNEVEIAALLEHIDEESQRAREALGVPDAEAGLEPGRSCCLKQDNLILSAGSEPSEGKDGPQPEAPAPVAPSSSVGSLLTLVLLLAAGWTLSALVQRSRTRAHHACP